MYRFVLGWPIINIQEVVVHAVGVENNSDYSARSASSRKPFLTSLSLADLPNLGDSLDVDLVSTVKQIITCLPRSKDSVSSSFCVSGDDKINTTFETK